MKKTLAILSLALLAGAASAQMTPILPGGRSNPIASLPKILPNPLTGPYAGLPMNLPRPSVTPSIQVVLAPPAPAPVFLPAPAIESAPISIKHALPGLVSRFSALREEPKTKISADEEEDALGRIFDGETPRKSPSRPGQRINIPESELERDLGL